MRPGRCGRRPSRLASRAPQGDGYEPVKIAVGMNLVRRKVLSLSICAAAWPLVPSVVSADTFPSRPVHIVVGFPPGGLGDLAARLIGQPLQQRLGQPVVVDNRPGATGNVAAETGIGARPDVGTLILAGSKNAINASLYKNLPFNFIGDIAMVAG